MLARGEADAALGLLDSVASAPRLCAICRVYENYIQMATTNDSPVRSIEDLRGRRVSLGAAGSGAASIGTRLLRTAGLEPNADVAVDHMSLPISVQALRSGQVDALLWAGGIPTPALADTGIRLVDLGSLATPISTRFGPYYQRVRIPAGTCPSASIDTIGCSEPSCSAAEYA
jgi:uncharacterized protein